MNLRTLETQVTYNAYRRTVTSSTPCFLCLTEDMAYDQWKLVKNRFPYDTIAKPETHFLFCPKRHVAEAYNLNATEIMDRLP